MSERDVFRELNQYLSQQSTVDDLERWVVGHLQDALNSGNDRILELMNEVDVSLMRFRDRFIHEAEFMGEMDAVVREAETLRIPVFPDLKVLPEASQGDLTVRHEARMTSSLESLEYRWLAAAR